eukprot:m51a1_g14048 hypothetical protein (1075) ;mRNA; r:1186919-1192565
METPASARFRVRLWDFRAAGLVLRDPAAAGGQASPCSCASIEADWDRARVLRSESADWDRARVLRSESVRGTQSPAWLLEASFDYATRYADRLGAKYLCVDVWDGAEGSRAHVGAARVDLLTVATGPVEHSRELVDDLGRPCGRVSFRCEARNVSSVRVQLSGLCLVPGPTRVPPSGEPSLKYYLSKHKYSAGRAREKSWPSPPSLRVDASLSGLLSDALCLSLRYGEMTIGQARLPVSQYCAVPEQHDGAPGAHFESDVVASDKTVFGVLRGLVAFRSLPTLAQMTGGVLVDGVVDGGAPLHPSLPVPRPLPALPDLSAAQSHTGGSRSAERGDACTRTLLQRLPAGWEVIFDNANARAVFVHRGTHAAQLEEPQTISSAEAEARSEHEVAALQSPPSGKQRHRTHRSPAKELERGYDAPPPVPDIVSTLTAPPLDPSLIAIEPQVRSECAEGSNLPIGWISRKSGDATFYVYTPTGHRQWELPAGAPLPSGWVRVKDAATGRFFFADAATRKTQWTRPRSSLGKGTKMAGGWVEQIIIRGSPKCGKTSFLENCRGEINGEEGNIRSTRVAVMCNATKYLITMFDHLPPRFDKCNVSWLWKEVNVVLLFYSGANRASFNTLPDWRLESRRFCDCRSLFIVATQYDKRAGPCQVPKVEGETFAKMHEIGFLTVNATLPLEKSVSLLNARGAVMPCVLAQVVCATWLVTVLYDAWARGALAENFALLRQQMQWQMALVVLLNAAGALSTFSSWYLALPSTRACVGDGVSASLYIICQAALVTVPPAILYSVHPSYTPMLGLALTIHHAVFSHSYFFACMTDRTAGCTARQYLQYLAFPTLVYVPKFNFPRTHAFRVSFFLRMMLQALMDLLAMYEILTLHILSRVERFPQTGFLDLWIRLSAPAFLLWLVWFYGMFHCFLNAVAEVCMYANRDFYGDWWDSSDVAEWARKWNTTVQAWLGSIYVLLRSKCGVPRGIAVLLSILLSSCWHDFILSFALKKVTVFTTIFMSILVLLILFCKTGFGKRVNRFVGPLFVIVQFPLGFSLLIGVWSVSVMFTDKAVVMPHDFVRLCLATK